MNWCRASFHATALLIVFLVFAPGNVAAAGEDTIPSNCPGIATANIVYQEVLKVYPNLLPERDGPSVIYVLNPKTNRGVSIATFIERH